MKIYTKTGDDGTTGLLGSRRVLKDDARIDAYGTVDELNAWLGLARAEHVDDEIDAILGAIQADLFALGAALADPNPAGPYHEAVGGSFATRLEERIDALEASLPPLTCFILPGGSTAAARLHLARTVCRRAERLVVHLSHIPNEHVPQTLVVYLNRLSDFLFVIARAVNQRLGVADTPWSGL